MQVSLRCRPSISTAPHAGCRRRNRSAIRSPSTPPAAPGAVGQAEHHQAADHDAGGRHEPDIGRAEWAPGALGALRRRIMMPAQTAMKASSVPMETRSARISSGNTAASSGRASTPMMMVPQMRACGSADARGEGRRQKAVARHAIEDAALAIERANTTEARPAERADIDRQDQPAQRRDLARRRRTRDWRHPACANR